MACCGGIRAQFSQPGQIETAADLAGAPSPIRAATHITAHFEYVGKTGLTVTGPITGRRYRFNQPGASVEVDSRDAPGITAVPNLRRRR